MLPLAFLLAKAYLKRRKTQNIITVIALAIGIAILTTALSLTNGFVKALVTATIRAVPHVQLTVWDQSHPVTPDKKFEDRLNDSKQISGWSPYYATIGLISRRAEKGIGGRLDFASIFGIDPQKAVNALDLKPEEQKLLTGLGNNTILLGEELAFRLNVLPGDTVFLVVARKNDITNTKRQAFKVAGTFRTGNYQIDERFAFIDIKILAALTDNPGQILGYYLRLKDPNNAPVIAKELSINSNFSATSWQDQYRNLIQQLNLQKLIISIVLTMLIVVAGFGIINVLALIVFEKTQEIAILRAIGAKSSSILSIFLFNGLILGIFGIILGNLLGFGLSYYFSINPIKLPGDLYFITYLPVEMRIGDFLWVSLASLVTAVIASLIPARRATRIEPGKVIR